jgi:hypothetical protein
MPMARSTRLSRLSVPTLAAAALALALAGCAAPATQPSSTPEPEATSSGACEQVTVIVDFTVLDEPSVQACVAAGPATDVLAEAGVTTEGTVDYGDQVVCRVNDQPSPDEQVTIEGVEPFTETCETLSAAAFWGLWVKAAPDADWGFAEEGIGTLELSDGQSVGLVYTPATETIPPQG